MNNKDKKPHRNCVSSTEVVGRVLPEIGSKVARDVLTRSEATYVTVRQLAADPSLCFSVAMWRWYITNGHKNGLLPAIRRIGKKIVLRRDLVLKWIESHQRGVKK